MQSFSACRFTVGGGEDLRMRLFLCEMYGSGNGTLQRRDSFPVPTLSTSEGQKFSSLNTYAFLKRYLTAHMYLPHAPPTMHCIPLVYLYIYIFIYIYGTCVFRIYIHPAPFVRDAIFPHCMLVHQTTVAQETRLAEQKG